MYYPNIKTSDSEMRALKHLDKSVKEKIIPVFELTRSRITKNLPEGSLKKRLDQLIEAYGNYRFVLDLCTEEGLMNSETEDLFDESNDYENWLLFLQENTKNSVIPCVLYIEDGDKENFQNQAIKLHKKYEYICLRTSALDENASKLLNWLIEVIPQEKIILSALLYFIEPNQLDKYKQICNDYMRDVVGNKQPVVILFPASSFPKYITDMPGCEDDEGTFPATELILESHLQSTYPNAAINKSDFASVHPIRYKTGGGNWIPRIDVFDGQNFSYTRTRRNDGGYLVAASSLKNSILNNLKKSWGSEQISLAKAGKIFGKSPSYWISVRINHWITSRVD